jgi:hypothetical protein
VLSVADLIWVGIPGPQKPLPKTPFFIPLYQVILKWWNLNL